RFGQQDLPIIHLQHNSVPGDTFPVYPLKNIERRPTKAIINDINQGGLSRARLPRDDIYRAQLKMYGTDLAIFPVEGNRFDLHRHGFSPHIAKMSDASATFPNQRPTSAAALRQSAGSVCAGYGSCMRLVPLSTPPSSLMRSKSCGRDPNLPV